MLFRPDAVHYGMLTENRWTYTVTFASVDAKLVRATFGSKMLLYDVIMTSYCICKTHILCKNTHFIRFIQVFRLAIVPIIERQLARRQTPYIRYCII